MPIVPSRSGRIQELLGRLASGSPAERDAAVAGLRLLGTRVLEPLGLFLSGAAVGREARLAALELLDGIDERAALALILDLTGHADEAVARRAIEAAGARADRRAVPALAAVLDGRGAAARRRDAARALARLQAAGAVEALDALTARLLDEREDPGLRVAILDALSALHPPLAPATLRPLLKRLATSRDPEVAGRAASAGPGSKRPARPEDHLLQRLVAPDQAPEEVARTIAAIARRGAPAIPQVARALAGLGPLRARRADASSLRARAALHEALAALDSRVALHDLREALEAHPRSVMPALLRAASRVGDASVVPALARAVAEETTLLDPCAEALAAILTRERLRKAGAMLKAVRPEHRTAFDLLWERARAVRSR